MHLLCGFTARAALLAASLVIGAPITDSIEEPRLERRSNFSITQIKNPSFKGFVTSGVAQRAKAYAKYGKTIPDDVAAAISGLGSTGSDPANPVQDDAEYLCPVQLGTPAQALPLDFDTGSADLWVFSSQTPNGEVNHQTLYHPERSTTAKLLSGELWSINYADSSFASGNVYHDVVSVGGISFPEQAVESATNISGKFTKNSGSSGLLGLSFGSINTVLPDKQMTFFENVMNSLAAPLFTADLKKGQAGSYDFGYIDSQKFTGGISYTPVNNQQRFWGVTGSGYAVGSGNFKQVSIDAIVDAGTTLLIVPDSISTAYYSQVAGSRYDTNNGGYTVPCSATLPSFTFGIGSYLGVIPGNYINYVPVGEARCYGGIQPSGDPTFAVYGDILLKTQFVVFDYGNLRVGFANKPT